MPFSSRIGCDSRRQQHGKAAGFVMHVRTISLAPRDPIRARVHHLRNLHSDFLRQGYCRSSTAGCHACNAWGSCLSPVAACSYAGRCTDRCIDARRSGSKCAIIVRHVPGRSVIGSMTLCKRLYKRTIIPGERTNRECTEKVVPGRF